MNFSSPDLPEWIEGCCCQYKEDIKVEENRIFELFNRIT